MSQDVLNAIYRQKNEIIQDIKSKFIPRQALSRLVKSMDEPLVKVITGPRRCGKSTLARQSIAGRSFAYLNFEDEAIPSNVSGDQLMDALGHVYGRTDVFFFDEIQNMDRWEPFIHRLHREGKNCIVTGSNAHLLSAELASALTGRHIAIELLPFSYREYLSTGITDNIESFESYLNNGGYPQVTLKQVDAVSYLSTLWDAMVLKDVVRRHGVRNVAALNNVYNLMINAVASRFNYESLSRAHGNEISSPTVKKFVHYAREAYLLTELEQFNFATRKRIKSDRKAYTYDNGFITALRVPVLKDLGKLLENAVFLELLRRGFRQNIDLFYYVSKSGYEVDFFTRARGSLEQELIQVTWLMSNQKTRERELRALREAANELGTGTAKILTLNQREVLDLDGVRIDILPVSEWLLT